MMNFVRPDEPLTMESLTELISNSTYIVGIQIVEKLEDDGFGFEGGDNWIFDTYKTRIEQQFYPTKDMGEWTNTSLSMPGRKEQDPALEELKTQGYYIAFYDYHSQARGCSLEGLITWDADTSAQLEKILQL